MKAIKLTLENYGKIKDALAEVNKKAFEHVFWQASQILEMTGRASDQLSLYNLPKGQWKGAIIRAVSGAQVSRSYDKHGARRIATFVEIECRASGWFLTKVERREIDYTGGYFKVCLTPQQKADIVELFKVSICEI